jgi:hypothetical protein
MRKGNRKQLSASSQKAHRAWEPTWEASAESAWCLAVVCLPYFDNHLGWKYNFIYVTCICNFNGRPWKTARSPHMYLI